MELNRERKKQQKSNTNQSKSIEQKIVEQRSPRTP